MTSRMAKCCECGKTMPSAEAKADPTIGDTFTDCGPGGSLSEVMCIICGGHVSGHDARPPNRDAWRDHLFQPGHVDEFDDFYCGCRGPNWGLEQ